MDINKEKKREQNKRYRESHREQILKHNREYNKTHREQIRNYFRRWQQDKIQRWRLEIIRMLSKGTMKCSNCGCSDTRILEINHINGGGCRETDQGNRNSYFYRDIIKGVRKTNDLNVLCKVCNIAHFVKKKYGIDFEIKPKP